MATNSKKLTAKEVDDILYKIAKAAIQNENGKIKNVVFPAVDEATLRKIVQQVEDGEIEI